MANQEQLEILLQGVENWNNWRKDNPTIIIDLTDANLNGVDLKRANLKRAHLSGAKLFKQISPKLTSGRPS